MGWSIEIFVKLPGISITDCAHMHTYTQQRVRNKQVFVPLLLHRPPQSFGSQRAPVNLAAPRERCDGVSGDH